MPDNKSLVDANRIKLDKKVKIDELKEQITLVPNRKMLLVVKFNLWSYYIGNKLFPRDTIKSKIGRKIKYLLVETIGEKPIYLDSNLLKKSSNNLHNYLFQKGYFYNNVSYKVNTYLKRSIINYNITLGPTYSIKSIAYNGSDMLLDQAVNNYASKSLIKQGDIVDYEKLTNELNRITNEFRNDGFYYFNKSFIEIEIDTGGHNKMANISYNISNPGEIKIARRQTIQKVVVEMNFKQRFGRRDTLKYEKVHYLFNGYNIKPNIINRSVLLKPGNLFSQTDLENTYKKIIGLGLFKSVIIRVLPYSYDSANRLTVHISLTPSAKYEYTIEPQVLISERQTDLIKDNNQRNYGLAFSFIFNNKNVLRNAEDFNIRYKLATETQFGGTNKGVPVEIFGKKFYAGNYESNLTFELLYPKLIAFRKIDLNKKLKQNRTSINVNYLVEINTNYKRRSIPINLTYRTFYETRNKNSLYLDYSPIQLSFNNSDLKPEFIKKFNNSYDSFRLVTTFRNYIKPSQQFSIVFNNKNKNKYRYWAVRSNIFELSGNLLNLSYNLFFDSKSKEKMFLGLPYFQYARSEVDAVRYLVFDKNKSLVLRVNIGIGKAYGNSKMMPFERQFFVGGSNSLRAWRPRVLGPGLFNDTKTYQIDKTGDLMLVNNAEFRFAVAPGAIDGAFFIDAGNIWYLNDSTKNETKFQFKTFYKQLAVNTGIGLRFDLEFFKIRVDWGIPLHDPSEPKDQRWVIKDVFTKRWFFDRTVLNAAIGLPFEF
ncbi:MAG: BamA/TamA family outer membrane protein [Bacteroidia bacterium]|nr:BamA/TamA family outer membrane protein [Bacteroidia bacterium]